MDYLKKTVKKIFQYQARLVLKKYKPRIIAITGSVGKTLTRETIYLVLSKKFFVRKNERSFTTELGIPLTVIGCPSGVTTPIQLVKNILAGLKLLVYKNKYPDWLILEMDSDKPGDLSAVSSFLSADVLIMTAIGQTPSHIESFPDMESFLFENRSIINAVKRNGIIIYNADDERNSNLLLEVASKKISCGIGAGVDIQGSDFKVLYSENKRNPVPVGMSFKIISGGDQHPVIILGSIGAHNEYACLLAFALGLEVDISPKEIVSALSKYKILPGRMNLIPGIKDTVIIDDSYNSSPVAMIQALAVFKELKTKGRKIVVLGDMLELGKHSVDEHRKLAELVKDSVSKVICVGIRMRILSEELLNLGFDEGNILSFDTSTEAGKELQNIIEEKDIVLVKGSQTVRMEKVVEEIMQCPEDKEKLLVRQEEEWLNR